MEGFAFDCPCCGKRFTGLPAITYDDGPAPGFNDAGEPWEVRRNGKDFCVCDGQRYFVRVVLRVPILGVAEPMEWGVWGSLSEVNFGAIGTLSTTSIRPRSARCSAISAMRLPAIPAASIC